MSSDIFVGIHYLCSNILVTLQSVSYLFIAFFKVFSKQAPHRRGGDALDILHGSNARIQITQHSLRLAVDVPDERFCLTKGVPQ